MAQKGKIVRKVYKDLIKEAIFQAIESGELKPGDRVYEMEWAERFNTSQAPVREAIRDLESMGVIVSVTFKGSYVRTMTDKDIRDFQSIRAGLEAIALRSAVGKMTDENVAELGMILADMKAAAQSGNDSRYVEKNMQFHEKIIDCAEMTDLKKFWNMCNIRWETSVVTKRTKKELIDLAQRHDIIYRCVANRDASNAFGVMTDHFEDIVE